MSQLAGSRCGDAGGVRNDGVGVSKVVVGVDVLLGQDGAGGKANGCSA